MLNYFSIIMWWESALALFPLILVLSYFIPARRRPACNCWNIKNYNFHITILTGIPFLQTQWNFRVTSPRGRTDDRKFMPRAPLIAAPDLRPFTVALMAHCVCKKQRGCFILPLCACLRAHSLSAISFLGIFATLIFQCWITQKFYFWQTLTEICSEICA